MAITYLKKSPKTASADDTKTSKIVEELLKNIESTKEQGCIDLTKKFDKFDGDIVVSKERIEEITEGRFISSQSGKATFFVEDIINNELSNIFFSSDKGLTTSVENSKTASYYLDKDNHKHIILKEGIINEITSANGLETRITKYNEHVIQLGQDIPLYKNKVSAGKPTIDLFFSNETTDHAELQYRLLLPIASLILGLIAIPLSYSSPKKGRYSKIFLGAIIYFIYFISMAIAKKIYLLAYIPSFFGLWWIHILVAGMLIYVYYIDSHKIPGRG